MTIVQCKYVLKIQKCGSFNEAAKQLFVAQSGLSGSVKALEDELNIKIFERSKNGVILTEQGAEFVRYAAQLVAQNEFIENRYRSAEQGAKLSVSTQHYDFIADVFCELIRETADEKYRFSLQEKQTYEVIRDVEIGYSDLGIIAIKDNDFDIMSRYLQNKGILFCELLQTPPHVFFRAGHPLSEKRILRYEELKNYPYVSYEQGAHSDSWFTEELINDFDGNRQIVISDRASLMNVLLKTDCCTVGTGIMPSALNNGKIVCVPIECGSYYSVGYILQKNRSQSNVTKHFMKLLNQFAGTV